MVVTLNKYLKLSIRIPRSPPGECKFLAIYKVGELKRDIVEISIECNSEGNPVFEFHTSILYPHGIII